MSDKTKSYSCNWPVKHNGTTYRDAIELTDKEAARLLKLGAISQSDASDAEPNTINSGTSNDGTGELTEDQKLEKVVALIGQLDPEEPAHWTKGGEPDAKTLGEKAGFKVSAALRDQAWLAAAQAKQ